MHVLAYALVQTLYRHETLMSSQATREHEHIHARRADALRTVPTEELPHNAMRSGVLAVLR